MFGLSGEALGDSGGNPDPNPVCPPDASGLPSPDHGKFLRGEFTVAKGKCACLNYPEDWHYDVHVTLKWGNQIHLYSFTAAMVSGGLCNVTSEDLKSAFALFPCNMYGGVIPGNFGLSGIPVITNLEILHTDFCGTDNEMIKGELVLRVVPVE
jgi:hypothetical protein